MDDNDIFTRVFLTNGAVAHLIPTAKAQDDKHPARCGTSPRLLGDFWRGTYTEGEYDRAQSLRLCDRCAVNSK
jgi:hypothetical protein